MYSVGTYSFVEHFHIVSWKTLTGICDHIRTRVLLKILRYITTPRIPNEAKYLTIIDGCWSDFRIFHFTETQNI